MKHQNLDLIRDFSVSIAQEAATIMRTYFEIGASSKTNKSDNSPLTIADTTINQRVIDKVRSEFEGHTILGEEDSYGDHSKAEFTWVVDPIDGTRPYAMGIPTSVFSLALTQHGVPIVAVVYDPWTDRMYEATKGQGALLNGKKLTITSKKTIDAYTHFGNEMTYESWKHVLSDSFEQQGAHLMRIGSFVNSAMLVAASQFEFSIFGGSTAHDVAAAALIVQEAGGVVTDLQGNDQRYDQAVNGLIVSNGGYHTDIVKRISEIKQIVGQNT